MTARTIDRNFSPMLSNSAPCIQRRPRRAPSAGRAAAAADGAGRALVLARRRAAERADGLGLRGLMRGRLDCSTPRAARRRGSATLAIALPTSAAAAASSAISSARAAREQADQRAAQHHRLEVARDRALEAERDLAALLGHHDHDRIGVLGDAERRAVARAELGAEVGRARQRQQRARELDAVALADHDGAVVQLVVASPARTATPAAGATATASMRVASSTNSSSAASRSNTMIAPIRARASCAHAATTSSTMCVVSCLRPNGSTFCADPAERAPDVLLEHDDDEDDEVAR